MKKYLFIAIALLAAALWIVSGQLAGERHERIRLEGNQEALMMKAEFYRTRDGKSAASVQALTLRCNEYKRLMGDAVDIIKALDIKIRRLEAVSTTATKTRVEFDAPLRDTTVPTAAGDQHEVCKTFEWADPWVSVAGVIRSDSVHCTVESSDTLRQIVHRIPRRFLFIRYGTKAIRQEAVSSNPHSKIVYQQYIQFTK